MKRQMNLFLALCLAFLSTFSSAATSQAACGAGGLLNGNNAANVLNGTPNNDTIFGKGGNDTLNGAECNDKLDGGPGNDTIHSGTGRDKVNGGPGNDICFVNPNRDSVINCEVIVNTP